MGVHKIFMGLFVFMGARISGYTSHQNETQKSKLGKKARFPRDPSKIYRLKHTKNNHEIFQANVTKKMPKFNDIPEICQ